MFRLCPRIFLLRNIIYHLTNTTIFPYGKKGKIVLGNTEIISLLSRKLTYWTLKQRTPRRRPSLVCSSQPRAKKTLRKWLGLMWYSTTFDTFLWLVSLSFALKWLYMSKLTYSIDRQIKQITVKRALVNLIYCSLWQKNTPKGHQSRFFQLWTIFFYYKLR